jgi:hypothetical protein
VENKKVTLGAFLDMAGAFDSTSHNAIIEAAKRHGFRTQSVNGSAPCCTTGKSQTLAGETLKGSVARGCPQGSVLLPLPRSLAVDELIQGLNVNGYYMLGYADDIAILASTRFLYTVSELLQEALSMAQQWCDRTQLSTNPQKMVTVPFTRKRDLRNQPSLDTYRR